MSICGADEVWLTLLLCIRLCWKMRFLLSIRLSVRMVRLSVMVERVVVSLAIRTTCVRRLSCLGILLLDEGNTEDVGTVV